jgi:RHS repeat-associated protein
MGCLKLDYYEYKPVRAHERTRSGEAKVVLCWLSGDPLTEKTPKGITTFTLNNVGKVTTKTITGLNGDTTNATTTYNYDPTYKYLLKSTYTEGTPQRTSIISYNYDAQQRLISTNEANSQSNFRKSYAYDVFGRIDIEDYRATSNLDGARSRNTIKYNYTNGIKQQITDASSGKNLYYIKTVNERGQLLNAIYGENIGNQQNDYDVYGMPRTSIFTTTGGIYANPTPFLKLTSTFNPITGNLTNRSNNMFGWSENFTNSYDNLDRLLNYKDASGTVVNQTYDDKGRIGINNLGTYNYTDTNHPYRATSVELPTLSTNIAYYTNRKQEIGYNAFKKPDWITEEGKENIDFEYNVFGERSAMYYGGLQSKDLRPFRKFYSADGSMEIRRDLTDPANPRTEFIIYIGGDAYSSQLAFKNNGQGVNENYLYLHRDYQGSILAITNDLGQVVEKRLFDAWGTLINYQNINGVNTVPTTEGVMLFDRGYTGHEHLLGAGIINMNGRMYDPKIHRFLSPDNDIQDPNNTQNYNRYAYVLNNPLRYSDPSGENWVNVVGFLFSVYVHGGAASGGQADPTKWSSSTWTNALLGATSSLVSGGLTNATNNYLQSYGSHPEISGTTVNPNENHTYVIGGVTVTESGYNPSKSFVTKKVDNWRETWSKEWSPWRVIVYGGPMSYHILNDFGIVGQFLIGRTVGAHTMRNIDGTAVSTEQGILGFVGVYTFFLGGVGEGLPAASRSLASKGGYGSMMEASEAARYAKYWEGYAPKQISPGAIRMDWLRLSGRTGRMESSKLIYDNYGRQIFRVDFSNHMRPLNHSIPHLHEYLYGPMSSFGKESVYNFFR